MESDQQYKIFFIGDCAATIDFGNEIDEDINQKVIRVFNFLSQYPLNGMIEAITAYSSITIYFDIGLLRKRIHPEQKVFDYIVSELQQLMQNDFAGSEMKKNLVRIPVCYEKEFALDVQWIAEQKGMSAEDIIRLHCSKQYRVYMIGFLPGFAYMGQVDEQIATPRKVQPQTIEAGSVGIAGRQTGIYPLNSPGGWQIIGRTPLKMFDKDKDQLCLLKAGNYVEFYSITKDEFESYQSRSV